MSARIEEMQQRLADFMDKFIPHYENHIVPHAAHSKPLDGSCKFCQRILKQRKESR